MTRDSSCDSFVFQWCLFTIPGAINQVVVWAVSSAWHCVDVPWGEIAVIGVVCAVTGVWPVRRVSLELPIEGPCVVLRTEKMDFTA